MHWTRLAHARARVQSPRREHAAGEDSTRRGLEHYRRAGEALLRAKERCGHGKWLTWLRQNVRFSERLVRNYMALAREWDGKSAVTADLEAEWQRISGNAPAAEDEPDYGASPPQPAGGAAAAELLAMQA